MKSICKWSCVFVIAALMLLAINPSTAEARHRHRHHAVRVAHHVPVYVAPVRVYAPVHRHHGGVNVVAPGVRVHVGGYRGVGVSVGRWGW